MVNDLAIIGGCIVGAGMAVTLGLAITGCIFERREHSAVKDAKDTGDELAGAEGNDTEQGGDKVPVAGKGDHLRGASPSQPPQQQQAYPPYQHAAPQNQAMAHTQQQPQQQYPQQQRRPSQEQGYYKPPTAPAQGWGGQQGGGAAGWQSGTRDEVTAWGGTSLKSPQVSVEPLPPPPAHAGQAAHGWGNKPAWG
ncbi:hypothetical protein HYH03_012767 [Edaphochlamys debaryana]|uniref:Uncharacterized protein n=1 Tax=Edaphochlamys debaryana TaxID=47281 RepID=A0A836BV91_9CHLO|nr:hypothetical protein HYH03_012767 [Edaphochlamys debaryana]|eukprot:KAG2488769.1 hypothetical protein HYH03_012767 [Edaphochlamys debaryana]